MGIVIVFLVDFIHEKKLTVEKLAAKLSIGVRWILYIVLTLLLLFVVVRCYGQAASTFIYERF